MKLVYTRWKDVKKFLASIDEPFLSSFCIIIKPRLQPLDFPESASTLERLRGARIVYDVEIPREFIDGSSELGDP